MSKVNHRANAQSLLAFVTEEKPVRRREEPKQRRQKAVPKRAKVVPYKFDANAQKAPNVGETVAVRHRTEEQANGSVRLVREGNDTRVIAQVYMSESKGYSIKDNCGEQWLVRPASVGNAKWETFIPNEGRKELV